MSMFADMANVSAIDLWNRHSFLLAAVGCWTKLGILQREAMDEAMDHLHGDSLNINI